MYPTAPSSMNALVADKSSSASASAFNSCSNDFSFNAKGLSTPRSCNRMMTRRKLKTLRRSFTSTSRQ